MEKLVVKTLIKIMNSMGDLPIACQKVLVAKIQKIVAEEYKRSWTHSLSNQSALALKHYSKYEEKEIKELNQDLTKAHRFVNKDLLDIYVKLVTGANIAKKNICIENCRTLSEQWQELEKYQQQVETFLIGLINQITEENPEYLENLKSRILVRVLEMKCKDYHLNREDLEDSIDETKEKVYRLSEKYQEK